MGLNCRRGIEFQELLVSITVILAMLKWCNKLSRTLQQTLSTITCDKPDTPTVTFGMLCFRQVMPVPFQLPFQATGRIIYVNNCR